MFDTQARDWMLRGGRRTFRYEIRRKLTFRFENSMSVFYLVEEKTDRAGELFFLTERGKRETEKDGIDVRGIIEGKFYVFILIHPPVQSLFL